MMNETQRQAYLHAMGIQPYYPRVLIHNARPSPQYDLVLPATDRARQRDDTGLPPADMAPMGRPDLQAKPDSNLTRTSRTPAVKAAPRSPLPSAVDNRAEQASGATTTEQSAALRFCINYYRITDTLAVIDEVPYQQGQKPSAAATALLLAIVRATGIDIDRINPAADTFNWPINTSITMKNDPALEAQLALQGYITMRQQTDGFKNLIVFAAQITDLFPAANTQNERDIAVANGGYHVVVTHSIQSLLAVPVLKREVWAHLQPLCRRLVPDNN